MNMVNDLLHAALAIFYVDIFAPGPVELYHQPGNHPAGIGGQAQAVLPFRHCQGGDLLSGLAHDYRIFHHRPAIGGRPDPLAAAHQQRAAQLLLQRPDVFAHIGLRGVQTGSGTGQAALFAGRSKYFKLPQIHKTFPLLPSIFRLIPSMTNAMLSAVSHRRPIGEKPLGTRINTAWKGTAF